jgi:hypothetical protein
LALDARLPITLLILHDLENQDILHTATLTTPSLDELFLMTKLSMRNT